MTIQPAVCSNCGAEAVAEFCPGCGQHQRDPRVSFGWWLRHFLEEQLSLDGRLPRTLRALFTQPGFLTEEWLAGRRARHTTPIRLYILASLVFFAIASLMGWSGDVDASTLRGLSGERVISLNGLVRAYQESRLQGFLPPALMAVVPLLACWLRLTQRRVSKLYVDHLIFSLHVLAFSLLAMSVAFVVARLVDPGPVGLTTAFLLPTVIYWTIAWRRTYKSQREALGTVFSFGVCSVVWLPLVSWLVFAVFMADDPTTTIGVNVSWTEHTNRLYNAALGADRSGDSLRAHILSTEALQGLENIDPDFLPTHGGFHRAELLILAERSDSADTVLRALLASDPTDLLTLGLAGTVAASLGDTARAREYFVTVLDLVDSGVVNDAGHSASMNTYLETARGLTGRDEPSEAGSDSLGISGR